jgi:hypothetical protein
LLSHSICDCLPKKRLILYCRLQESRKVLDAKRMGMEDLLRTKKHD